MNRFTNSRCFSIIGANGAIVEEEEEEEGCEAPELLCQLMPNTQTRGSDTTIHVLVVDIP